MQWSGNQMFEYMTGRKIEAEPNIDRMQDEGRIDPSEAEGWSMGDCMDAIVVRIIRTSTGRMSSNRARRFELHFANRRDMIDAVEIPDACRFESEDISEVSVYEGDAPPHIHGRRRNWTRWLRFGYDSNNSCNDVYAFVFYENWVDSALYAGNVMLEDITDIQRCLAVHEGMKNEVIVSSEIERVFLTGYPFLRFPDPKPDEVLEKKAARNRAKRERRKERKRELAAEKAEEEAQRERERKEKDDGIEGIHKGRKGCQQLAEEEVARRRKELAESHREWERLHPKSERITVRGESHKETPKTPKPEPTIEERIARMDFEEKRGDRRFDAEKKKADAHADKLRRDAEAKAKAEREMVKQAGMSIAEAANPKAPPMTFARKAGL
jgi:hypothetical protein